MAFSMTVNKLTFGGLAISNNYRWLILVVREINSVQYTKSEPQTVK